MGDWRDFCVAQAGASADLTGLLFVAISISLEQIMKFPHLLFRGAVALGLLGSVLVVSTLLVAPQTSVRGTVLEIIGFSSVAWILLSAASFSGWRQSPQAFRQYAAISMGSVQIAMIPFLIAGFAVVFSGVDGLFWLIPAFVCCFIVAVVDAWILLVEIHR